MILIFVNKNKFNLGNGEARYSDLASICIGLCSYLCLLFLARVSRYSPGRYRDVRGGLDIPAQTLAELFSNTLSLKV